MNFGKITFGALLLAVGVLLLTVRLGFTHPDTPIVLLRYWPVILIAFGLAFLAGAIKNPLLGCLAIMMILGGTAFGMYWMHRLQKQGKLQPAGTTLDLGKTGASSLLVRVYTFAGSFDLAASPTRKLTVSRHDAAMDSAVGYRFDVNGGKAVLVWPRDGGTFSLSVPGAQVEVRAPPLPMTLRWSGRLGSMHADLRRLLPTRCLLHQIFSTSRIDLGNSGRPEEIRVWGVASTLKIRIPADCPIRVVSQSPFVLRSLPSDFEELATGRGRDRIDAAEGRGRPVQVYVSGPFMSITIERMPVTALSTQEGMAWPDRTGIASRSPSPSS